MRSETTELPSQFCCCFAISVLCSPFSLDGKVSLSQLLLYVFGDSKISGFQAAVKLLRFFNGTPILREIYLLNQILCGLYRPVSKLTHFSVIILEICYQKNLYITGIVTGYGPQFDMHTLSFNLHIISILFFIIIIIFWVIWDCFD